MNRNELLIVSTTKTGLNEEDAVIELLAKPFNRICCSSNFEDSFYPILGIDNHGKINCFCDEYPPSKDLKLIIIPHSEHFDNNPYALDGAFSNYIKSVIIELDVIYVLLHEGSGSIHDTHQKAILDIGKNHLQKIKVTKCHHTRSISNDPKYAIGDGLQMVAKSMLNNNFEELNEGFNYLKSKPEYFSPLLESLIHLYKSTNILPLKLKNDWNENSFNSEKEKLSNSVKINLTKNRLDKIFYKKEIMDYYTQLESIETEINQLSIH